MIKLLIHLTIHMYSLQMGSVCFILISTLLGQRVSGTVTANCSATKTKIKLSVGILFSSFPN